MPHLQIQAYACIVRRQATRRTDSHDHRPEITFTNGVRMPQLGFGVFQVPCQETAAAVTTALDSGYRSIDTAVTFHDR
jgi:hypothetical protein